MYSRRTLMTHLILHNEILYPSLFLVISPLNICFVRGDIYVYLNCVTFTICCNAVSLCGLRASVPLMRSVSRAKLFVNIYCLFCSNKGIGNGLEGRRVLLQCCVWGCLKLCFIRRVFLSTTRCFCWVNGSRVVGIREKKTVRFIYRNKTLPEVN